MRYRIRPSSSRLGAALQERRGALTQAEVGAKLGLSHATISRFESGAVVPSIAAAATLAEWLGWTSAEVLHAAALPVVAARASKRRTGGGAR